MIEGGSSRSFEKIKRWMYSDPRSMHALLEKLADAVALYLNAQIAAGAEAVMIFDTWGGNLSTEDYLMFSLAYARSVRERLSLDPEEGNQIPTIFFTKGGGQWLETMADSGYSALGLDWTTDLGLARSRVGNRVALQGNMDPMVLFAEPAVIREKVRTVLERYGKGSGHVFNLGHGIVPGIDPENVQAMVEAVHEFSPANHR